MNLRMGFFAVAMAFSLVKPLVGQVTPAEEHLVRLTYAKISFASDLGLLHRAVATLATPKQLDELESQNRIIYTINSIAGGSLASAADQPYHKVVTPRIGDVLSLSQSTFTAFDSDVSTVESYLLTGWTTETESQSTTALYTLKQVVASSEDTSYTRYATVNVSVSMGAKSRTYNAVFLFNPRGDIFALDQVSGVTSTTWIANESVNPAVILNTRTRLEPITIHWLASHEIKANGCASSSGSACCDVSVMRCGVTAEKIETSFSTQARRPELVGMLQKARAAVAYEQSVSGSKMLSPDAFRTDYKLSDCSSNNYQYNTQIDGAQGSSQHFSAGFTPMWEHMSVLVFTQIRRTMALIAWERVGSDLSQHD